MHASSNAPLVMREFAILRELISTVLAVLIIMSSPLIVKVVLKIMNWSGLNV